MTTEEIQQSVEHKFNEAVDWTYGEHGDDVGAACADLQEYMLPIINKAIEDAASQK